jgi:hypothetical protein
MTTMPTPDPAVFGDEWVRAWNAHDVEAVLALDVGLVREGHGTYLHT